MDNVDELKLVRVGKEIPEGFEVVETGDKNDLSDETIDALALKAIKNGTIQIARKVQGDEERKAAGEPEYKLIRDDGDAKFDIPEGWSIVGTLDPAMETLRQRFIGPENEWEFKNHSILIITNKLGPKEDWVMVEKKDGEFQAPEGFEIKEIDAANFEEYQHRIQHLLNLDVIGKFNFGHVKFALKTKDEPKKEANLGDFIGAMGGLMAAFAPGEEGQQIQKEVNQMAAMFGASPDSKKKDESKKEADLGDFMGAMGGLMAALAPQEKPQSDNVINVVEVVDKEIVGKDNKLGMTKLNVPQLVAHSRSGWYDLNQWVRLEQSECGELLISTEYIPSEAKPVKKETKEEDDKPEEKTSLAEGSIHLSVTKARDLMYGKANPKANPYIKVTLGNQTAKSPTIENNQHPDWNYNVFLDIFKDSPEEVIIEIFDEIGFTKDEEKPRKSMPATVTFIFRPKQEASLVEIAGSFNDWSKAAMAKDGGHWRVSLRMKPGRHQYKYIVDGKWQHDENLPPCDDEHGGCNNVINVDYEDDYKKCPYGHPLESKIGSDPERLSRKIVINCNICLEYEMPNHEIQEGDQRHSCLRCLYDLCDGCYNNNEAVVTALGIPAVDQRDSLGTFIRMCPDRVPMYWKDNDRYKDGHREKLWLDVEDSKKSGVWRVYTFARDGNEEGKESGDALKHSSDLNLEDPYRTYLPPKTGWMFYSSSGEWIKDDTIEVLLKGAGKSNITFVESSGGSIPPNAFSAGKDENGETLYVGRAKHHTSLIPGKFQPSAGVVYVSFGGKEHAKDKYEVLVQEGNIDNLRWINASHFHHVISRFGDDPLGGVRCGYEYEDDGSPLYVARAKIGEQRVIGKVGAQEHKCWMPLNGQEVEIYSDLDYEVLCCNALAVKEYNSDGVLSTKKEEADQDEEDSSAEAGNNDGNTVQCAQQ